MLSKKAGLWAGATAAAGLAAAGLARRQPLPRESDVYKERLDSPFRIAGHEVFLPIEYHRSEAFQGLFTADSGAVRAILPSDRLHPVLIRPGRAVFVVAVLRHHEATVREADGGVIAVRPYGEVVLGPVVSGRKLPMALPVLRNPIPDDVGAWVMHMPVTTREARDLGRVAWGFPKFVADMEFREDGEDEGERGLILAEGGREIFRFTLAEAGRARIQRSATLLFTVLDGQLIQTTCPATGYIRRAIRPKGSIILGTHPVAEELRQLGLSERPFAGQVIAQQRLLLPEGVPGGAARPYIGFGGVDRELGGYVVSYPGSSGVDLYAAPAGRPVAAGSWSAEVEGVAAR